MTAAVLTQLSFAVIWAAVGSLATWLVMSVRRDRAEAAAVNERVEAEFAPTLARWRPTIDMASHLRPLGAAVKGRIGRVAGAAVAAAGLADRVRVSVSAPAPQLRHAAPARDITALDTNTVVWPVNPPAPVDLDFNPLEGDFTLAVRRLNNLLRHQPQVRALDPDATGYLPKVPAEGVAR